MVRVQEQDKDRRVKVRAKVQAKVQVLEALTRWINYGAFWAFFLFWLSF